jgi:hypothetical protein
MLLTRSRQDRSHFVIIILLVFMYKTDTVMIILLIKLMWSFCFLLLQAWASGTGSYLVLRRVRVYVTDITMYYAQLHASAVVKNMFFPPVIMHQDDTDIYWPSCTWT